MCLPSRVYFSIQRSPTLRCMYHTELGDCSIVGIVTENSLASRKRRYQIQMISLTFFCTWTKEFGGARDCDAKCERKGFASRAAQIERSSRLYLCIGSDRIQPAHSRSQLLDQSNDKKEEEKTLLESSLRESFGFQKIDFSFPIQQDRPRALVFPTLFHALQTFEGQCNSNDESAD